MCADMTACTYKQVNVNKKNVFNKISLSDEMMNLVLDNFILSPQLQHEASMSMQFWDNPTVDGFHSLLMTPKPVIRTSDHVFQYGSW